MDKREAIIQRLFEVVNAVSGLTHAARNVIEFDDTQLPAAGILEGDEEVSDSDLARGRPSSRPYLVTATPQVFVRARATDDVGTDLNTLRRSLIAAVLSDTELNSYTLNGVGVRYAGMQSTLHAGRSMVGAFALVFAVTYALSPSDL